MVRATLVALLIPGMPVTEREVQTLINAVVELSENGGGLDLTVGLHEGLRQRNGTPTAKG